LHSVGIPTGRASNRGQIGDLSVESRAAMSAIVEISHSLEFSAAHRLHNPNFTDAENLALYGPCNTLHGHNYGVEVTVRGPLSKETGMVMDLNVLMKLMQSEIFEPVDHKNLGTDVPFLEGVISTAENLSVVFWDRLLPHIKGGEGCRLHRVRVTESRSNRVDYYGPAAS